MTDNEPRSIQHTTPSTVWAPLLGTALAAFMVVSIGAYALHCAAMPCSGDCYEQELPTGEQGPVGIDNWDKPLVAIVLSGQMHGFIDPCGCSEPQYGGLVRRYNFIKSLKDKKWDVVGIDLGELPALKGIHEQNLLKYELSINALRAMNYRAIGIGRDEILLPLGAALGQIQDASKPRLIGLSLADALPGKNFNAFGVRQYEIIDTPKAKLGVISLMGPDLRDELKEVEKFLTNDKELPKALNAFAAAGVDIGVILHHEYPVVDKSIPPGIKRREIIEKKRAELALKCAEYCAAARKKNPKIPAIQIMMVLADEPEPPQFMRPLGKDLPTHVVEIGHKGRFVGVVGVYPDDKKYRLQYQLVHMNPDWKKEGTEKANPVIALMEKYNQELKQTNMLAKFQRSQHINQIMPANTPGLRASFVGSDRCGDCHPHAFQVWETQPDKKQTRHSRATNTLEELKHPSGRQFDPECMMCHTTGFKNPGGYNDLVPQLTKWPAKQAINPKKLAEHNKNLRGVGCESCHGPGSEHVKNPNDLDWRKLMNPYAPFVEERKLEETNPRNAAQNQQLKFLFNKRMDIMAQNLCMKCHDNENDVNWGNPGRTTADNWLKLIHRTPKKNNNGGAINPQPKGNGPVINNPSAFEVEVIQDKKK